MSITTDQQPNLQLMASDLSDQMLILTAQWQTLERQMFSEPLNLTPLMHYIATISNAMLLMSDMQIELTARITEEQADGK